MCVVHILSLIYILLYGCMHLGMHRFVGDLFNINDIYTCRPTWFVAYMCLCVSSFKAKPKYIHNHSHVIGFVYRNICVGVNIYIYVHVCNIMYGWSIDLCGPLINVLLVKSRHL